MKEKMKLKITECPKVETLEEFVARGGVVKKIVGRDFASGYKRLNWAERYHRTSKTISIEEARYERFLESKKRRKYKQSL